MDRGGVTAFAPGPCLCPLERVAERATARRGPVQEVGAAACWTALWDMLARQAQSTSVLIRSSRNWSRSAWRDTSSKPHRMAWRLATLHPAAYCAETRARRHRRETSRSSSRHGRAPLRLLLLSSAQAGRVTFRWLAPLKLWLLLPNSRSRVARPSVHRRLVGANAPWQRLAPHWGHAGHLYGSTAMRGTRFGEHSAAS